MGFRYRSSSSKNSQSFVCPQRMIHVSDKIIIRFLVFWNPDLLNLCIVRMYRLIDRQREFSRWPIDSTWIFHDLICELCNWLAASDVRRSPDRITGSGEGDLFSRLLEWIHLLVIFKIDGHWWPHSHSSVHGPLIWSVCYCGQLLNDHSSKSLGY